MVMKMSNMQKTQPLDESEDEEDSDEEKEMKPDLDCAIIHHQGAVNRVRVCVYNIQSLAHCYHI
jgi:ribosome assembly protein RRB1